MHERCVPPQMEVIGDNDPCIGHELGQMRGLSARRSAKIQHGSARSGRQNQGGHTGGERLGMDVAEEILQQFARQKGPGSFIEGVVSDTGRSQGDTSLLKHRDDRSRGGLEAIHAKVIGKRLSEALQKEVEIGDKLAVLFEQLCHEQR